MSLSIVILVLLSTYGICYGALGNLDPQQIHLSYSDVPTSMMVTWSTMKPTKNSTVHYGLDVPNMKAEGQVAKFVDDGSLHHTQYMHRVKLTDLKPGTFYVYQVGSQDGGWSAVYNFTTMKEGNQWTPRIAFYGDLGLVNDHSVPRLINDVSKGMYDTILHVGDMAYDMYEENATRGDNYLNLIQPITARLAYMTCPGNHENTYNYLNYRKRFTMPGDEDGKKLYYSFDIGPAHIISFNTEYLFYWEQYGILPAFEQYSWLEKDLKKANENRKERPWIITMGHRPMYCSNTDHDDCTHWYSLTRFVLEKLFYEHGVDLELWAHEHSYERLWPVYSKEVRNGSYAEPYTNPKAPVHIITGSAGCQENLDPFVPEPRPWSAFRASEYGYSRMVMNMTHIYMEQVSADRNGTVIDHLLMKKDRPNPYFP